MFELVMHEETPPVYRLPVHLEGGHMVYFTADDDINDVVQSGAVKETELTAWFKLNQTNPDARNTTY